jgi:hypothetical protein
VLRELSLVWGPGLDKERVRLLLEQARGLSPKERAAIEAYIRELGKKAGDQK